MTSLFDPKGAVPAVWSPPALPTTYVVGPGGDVLEVLTGSLDEGGVAALIARLRAVGSGAEL